MSTWSEPLEPVQIFSYPDLATSVGLEPSPAGSPEEPATAIAAARDDGIREGESRARRSLEQTIASERAALRSAVEHLSTERSSFVRRLEPEVVKLALSIARKILHREVQVDPLILAGIVRSALERLDSTTRIRLHVSPAHGDRWREAIESSARTIEIVADTRCKPDSCRIETEVGTTDVSIDDSFNEIEKGLVDLITERSAVGGCQ